MIVRLWRIPQEVLSGKLLELVKLYDEANNRASVVWQLQTIFNENKITVKPICGLCDSDFLIVLNRVKEELKNKGLYESEA